MTSGASTVDYLGRDYVGLRRKLLDELSAAIPGWRDENPADAGVAIAELFAYLGDHLAYAQDVAAAEAYLGTARFRESVKRHARLIDYVMHDGCTARTWLVVDSDQDVVLEAGTEATTADDDSVFHTLHPVTVRRAHNVIEVDAGGSERAEIPAGAVQARLVGTGLDLRTGDTIAFEEIRSTQGPPRRCVVRLSADPSVAEQDSVLVTWHPEDAPRTPLRVWQVPSETGELVPTLVARGNVVLAEHGRIISTEPVVPAVVPEQGQYRPTLARPGLAHAVPYDHSVERHRPAAHALGTDPAAAVPAIVELHDGVTSWQVRPDVVASSRSAADYVVEMSLGRVARLRFGDGQNGRLPAAGTRFVVSYRLGGGPEGNVGRDTLTRLVQPVDGVRVRNCVPAVGGVPAQTTEQARLLAPHSFHVSQRAVTEADHADIAARHPLVDRARSVRWWTGSWYTVTTFVAPAAGVNPRGELAAVLARYLRPYGMAGQDIRVVNAVEVPLDIRLTVRVHPAHAPDEVGAGLRDAFTSGLRRDGNRGFFHPDNFSFGDPVHLSRIVAEAMDVPGVRWVDTSADPGKEHRFQRWSRPPAGELAHGTIPISEFEIALCLGDAARPDHGAIEFILEGGR